MSACALLVAAISLVSLAHIGADDGQGLAARSAGSTTDPVAVIDPLAETVSNGTTYFLDAHDSYDLENDLVNYSYTIVNYTWEITYENETDLVYGAFVSYRFHELGLYKIELTVTDAWNNTGKDFTAVISVDDLDYDGMPDWWESNFMGSMEYDADSDFDSDGYTNLCEWISGTLPNVADPPPPSEGFLDENWMYMAAGAAVAATVLVALYAGTRKTRKAHDAKKLEIALELEKSLDEE